MIPRRPFTRAREFAPSAARAELERRCTLGQLRTRLAELQRAHRRRGATHPAAAARGEFVPTGFAQLDAALGGGLHAGALNELLVAADGCGVFEALLPALARQPRLVAWIHPTRLPYPPALKQAGFELERLLLVRPRDAREQAWALDLALRSGACDAVIAWLHHLEDAVLRRLQLAAEGSGALGLLVRPAGFARAPSPAAVRLAVAPHAAPPGGARRRLLVTVLRCRGAAPSCGEPLILEWSRDPLDEPAPAALRAAAAAARVERAGAVRRALGA